MTPNEDPDDPEAIQTATMPEFGDGPEDCAELSTLEIGGE